MAAIDALEGVSRVRSIGDHGFVELIDVMPRLTDGSPMGAESAVVQAARVSHGVAASNATRSLATDRALLRYLFRNAHMTPFEMITLKFCIKAPLFTARQWMRHRTGSFNEQSARYSVVETEFYLPEMAAQSSTNKQGSGCTMEDSESIRDDIRASYAVSEATYERSIGRGVARELARVALPEGRYTVFYWSVNLRNLFHFLSLRAAPDAQSDIREYANAILGILKEYCPHSVQAFMDYSFESLTLSSHDIAAIKTGQVPHEMSAREVADLNRKMEALGMAPLSMPNAP